MSNDKVEIGKRIAALRNANGLSQENLAELLDCSVKHISHAERGLTYLSVEKYLFLSRYFDCSLDYMLQGIDRSGIEAYFPTRMIEILQGRDEHEKELLLSYLAMYSRIREDKPGGS
jgi:transcriptional regulator with XRE-family HTH domain